MASWYDKGDMSVRQMVDIPPVWLAGFLALVWAQMQFLPVLLAPTPLTSIIGSVLVCLGVVLMVWAVVAFRNHNTSVVPHQVPQRIITTGPFALSRNPIYLGDVFVLTGAVFWWGTWPALILIPAFVILLSGRFIAPEEARMKENFGHEFEIFAQNTRRWL